MWLPGLSDGLIAGMFFLTGLTLPLQALGNAAGHWRLHLVIQLVSFGIGPLLAVGLDRVLAGIALESDLRIGMMVTLCLPTTVSACVMFTRQAGGNHAGALCNAVLGNVLGILLTPMWIAVLAGGRIELDLWSAVLHLCWLVALPVVIGQFLRPFLAGWPDRHKVACGHLGSGLLLVAVYGIFCAGFLRPQASLPLSLIAGLICLVVALHLSILTGIWHLSAWRILGLTHGDRLAAAICASHRTGALGLPLVLLLYADQPGAGLAIIPLIAWHVSQNVIDGLMLPWLAKMQ